MVSGRLLGSGLASNIPLDPPSKMETTKVDETGAKLRGNSNIPLNPPSEGGL